MSQSFRFFPKFVLEPRLEVSGQWMILSPIIAIILTLFSGIIIFSLLGKDPFLALYTFFVQPLTTMFGITELLVKGTPLVLIGVGLAIGFKANVWNIGAEGQFTMGAVFGGGTALLCQHMESILVLPLVLVLGTLGGILWGAIPAFLKTRFNANEILTSLMLSYVAVLWLSYLVHGPWRDPAGFNFPESQLFSDYAMLPILIENSRLNLGALFAILVVLAAWILMARTIIGFQLRVVGLAPRAAHYAGFKQSGLIWLSFLISGGLAGLAGIAEVSGTIGQLLPSVSPGYGFTAIIVAFLARLNPLAAIPAGLIVALAELGGDTAQIYLGMPKVVTGVFKGLLLLSLLAGETFNRYHVRLDLNKKGFNK